jgi:CarboxypepD_reg-like domain/TonB-dependent Receptor Plug Domain
VQLLIFDDYFYFKMKFKSWLPFLIFFSLFTISTIGQVLEIRIEQATQDEFLIDFLKKMEGDSSARFFFLPQWLQEVKIKDEYLGETLGEALSHTLMGSDINFTELYGYAVVFSKDPTLALEREEIVSKVHLQQKKIDGLVIGSKSSSSLGKEVKVIGQITDFKSSDPLGGVSVSVLDIKRSTVTGPNGKYELSLPTGSHIISYQYLNYEEKIIDLEIFEDGTVNINLLEIPKLLEEVVISDQRQNAPGSLIGQTYLKLTELKKLPSFLGEVDVIKQIQTLPGVTSVGEVSSGFNVRGGGTDQNLVLYDGTQVFNNSHVFGFFSAFNSDAIKQVSFYKGGVPAEYGGRVSSVLDIASKDGNYREWEGSGGLGIVSSHLTLDGPIKKNVSSVIASFRSSYSDWVLKAFVPNYRGIQNSSVAFYDASLKLTHKFDGNNKLSFSGYISKDHFGLPNDTTFVWQNLLGSVHFDHIFNARTFSTVMMSYGEYSYQVSDKDPLTAYDLRYKISYPSLKADLNFIQGKHKLAIGVNSILYNVQLGSITPTSTTSNVKGVELNSQHSIENSFFVNDTYNLSEKLHINLGVRVPLFTSLGEADLYSYLPNAPKSDITRIDTTIYKSGQVVKNYVGIEPRFSLGYNFSQTSSIKFGYNRIFQYIHLVSNSLAINPIDIWQPSNYYFKPQQGDQVSLGLYTNRMKETYQVSIEGFYKVIDNILDFKDGAQLVLNPALETALLSGVAKSYGVEFSVIKTKGRLVGSLNYTYSRSFRKVVGNFDEEIINKGDWYPSNVDQPNIVNLNWKYSLSRRFFLTGNFTYRTGRPVTIPYSYSVIDNIPIVNFSERNGYRIPDYHRLDIALVIEGSHRRKKFWDGTWAFSFYNVYSRANVYSVFYGKNGNGLQSAYSMSIIGSIIPSISYQFKF